MVIFDHQALGRTDRAFEVPSQRDIKGSEPSLGVHVPEIPRVMQAAFYRWQEGDSDVIPKSLHLMGNYVPNQQECAGPHL